MSETSYESSLELIEDSDDENSGSNETVDSDYNSSDDGGDGLGYDEESEDEIVTTPSKVNWRVPISGISVSSTSQPVYTQPQPVYTQPQPQPVYTQPQPQPVYTQPQPVYTQPVYTQPQPVYTQPQPAFVVEIVKPEPNQPHPQVRFEKVGRNFLVQTPPGFFAQYRQYLEALRGTYEEFLQGQIGGSYLIGQWSFRSNQEDEIRNLIGRILSGELLPPNQLAPSKQINIDMSSTTIIPTTAQWSGVQNTQIVQTNAFAGSSGPSTTSSGGRKGRGRGNKVQGQIMVESIPPSQIIATTMSSQTIPISAPSVMNQGEKEAFLPVYDPLQKEPGESQSEYDVRKYLYQHCITNYQMSADDADKLSRMRNNVDIQGNEYNQNSMMVLNSYLPR
jgi:hypothetical protein